MTDDKQSDVLAQVTFMVKAGTEEALIAKARALDLDQNGVDDDLDYTIGQAIQIVWHLEPEWLHREVLEGWTMDRVCDDDEHGWHDVWPEHVPYLCRACGRPEDDCSKDPCAAVQRDRES